jgi:hypothetical protein
LNEEVEAAAKFCDLSLRQGRYGWCCKAGFNELAEHFPILKDAALLYSWDPRALGMDVFMDGMAIRSLQTQLNELKDTNARLDELELKLDVLLDMKRMGEIDRKNNVNRKRRGSF